MGAVAIVLLCLVLHAKLQLQYTHLPTSYTIFHRMSNYATLPKFLMQADFLYPNFTPISSFAKLSQNSLNVFSQIAKKMIHIEITEEYACSISL